MGERARRAAGHVSRTLGREHSGDPSHAAEGAHAVSGRARPEAREDDWREATSGQDWERGDDARAPRVPGPSARACVIGGPPKW